jgi:3-deoxy-7-phosphoheptulonate synthase
VRAETGLPIVTEVMDTRQVELVAEHADMLQVGARNMQNFALLSELGRVQRPVLLKRGLSATIQELLMAAEYIMAHGNRDVILCERGIRTFETATRNTLDVAAIPVLKRRDAPPRARGPEPRRRPRLSGGAALLRRDRRGRRRADHRGAPRSRAALSDGDQSLTRGGAGAGGRVPARRRARRTGAGERLRAIANGSSRWTARSSG